MQSLASLVNPLIVTYEWMKMINAVVANTVMMKLTICAEDCSIRRNNYVTPKQPEMQ